MSDATPQQRRRLRAHFRLSHMPFTKYAWASQMFDSQSQHELLDALLMWLELRGVAIVTGQSGVGKSITLRRFQGLLDENRIRLIEFAYLPTTVTGFLRSLCRKLGLPPRLHAADMFDAAQKHLVTYEQDQGAHPVILLDDAEGLSVPICDVLRRLTCYDLDAEDRFSLVLAGTDDLLVTLRHPRLAALRSRVAYAHALRPFGLEDTRNYVRHHLARADVDPKLFSDDAVRRLFAASQGRPRNINQLATQALIDAAVFGRDDIDGEFMGARICAHPLYQHSPGATQ